MRLAPNLLIIALLGCIALTTLADNVHAEPAEPAASAPAAVYLPLLASPGGAQTAEQAAMASKVLALVNAERAKAGCGALTADKKLTDAAQTHSKDMAANNFFDHRGSAGTAVNDRASATGYPWRGLAENIAAGYPTPEAVVAGWMDSAGHRQNILNCAYVHSGIGYVFEANDAPLAGAGWPYYHYWTQVFGTPG